MNARMNGVVAREATALADRAIDVGPARGIRLTGGVEEGGFVERFILPLTQRQRHRASLIIRLILPKEMFGPNRRSDPSGWPFDQYPSAIGLFPWSATPVTGKVS